MLQNFQGNFNLEHWVGKKNTHYWIWAVISLLIWDYIHIMKTACLQVQQHLKESILSYVLCQLSSKPTDQKHVTSIC